MKNELIEAKDGRKFWNSRSVSVTGIVYFIINNTPYILISKRGKGAADFQGLWNLPCGYIDFDETGEEAVTREINEETGYVVPPTNWKFFNIVTNPNQNHQNIGIRYYTKYDFHPMEITPINLGEGGEIEEVEENRWINISEINDYDFAFDHGYLIHTFINFIKDK